MACFTSCMVIGEFGLLSSCYIFRLAVVVDNTGLCHVLVSTYYARIACEPFAAIQPFVRFGRYLCMRTYLHIN